jgi:hypothetical protein
MSPDQAAPRAAGLWVSENYLLRTFVVFPERGVLVKESQRTQGVAARERLRIGLSAPGQAWVRRTDDIAARNLTMEPDG